MKLLIDTDFRRNAVTHKSVAVDKTVHWGNAEIAIPVLERMAFPPRANESWRSEQIPYIATMAALAKSREISLYSSFELTMEFMRQKRTGRGYLGIDLLEGVQIDRLSGPVERSVMWGTYESAGTTKQEQIEFVRSIKHDRFQQLLSVFQDAHILDTYHLWTAENGGLDGFVTLDKRFYNVATQYPT